MNVVVICVNGSEDDTVLLRSNAHKSIYRRTNAEGMINNIVSVTTLRLVSL